MGFSHWLLHLCGRDHDHHDHEEEVPPRTIPVTQVAPMPSNMPPLDGILDAEPPSEPPPGYTRFDPHPPGCNCPIHIKTTSRPTVIELFQSQGCNSCPATNNNIMSVLRHNYDPNVLFLDYQITYWDHLGWKDTWGNDAFNTRQWEYARRMGKERVYTPQVIINGITEGVGNSDSALKAVIKKGQDARKNEHWVSIEVSENSIKVSGRDDRKGRVLLVTYDTRRWAVDVKEGENAGRRLQFANVVKDIEDLGDWNGGEQSFGVERTTTLSKAKVVLVQEGKGGPIIGVRKV